MPYTFIAQIMGRMTSFIFPFSLRLICSFLELDFNPAVQTETHKLSLCSMKLDFDSTLPLETQKSSLFVIETQYSSLYFGLFVSILSKNH